MLDSSAAPNERASKIAKSGASRCGRVSCVLTEHADSESPTAAHGEPRDEPPPPPQQHSSVARLRCVCLPVARARRVHSLLAQIRLRARSAVCEFTVLLHGVRVAVVELLVRGVALPARGRRRSRDWGRRRSRGRHAAASRTSTSTTTANARCPAGSSPDELEHCVIAGEGATVLSLRSRVRSMETRELERCPFLRRPRMRSGIFASATARSVGVSGTPSNRHFHEECATHCHLPRRRRRRPLQRQPVHPLSSR